MKKHILTNFSIVIAIAIFAFTVSGQTKSGRYYQAISLSGTTWSGEDSKGDFYTFTFEEDGTLAYTSPTGSYRNGRWTQVGNAVHFEMNKHYSDYLGEISGNTMIGKAWNIVDLKWTFLVKKHTSETVK